MKATRASLVQDLRRLGVAPGDLVMVHAGLRTVGPVVGGAVTVVEALLETVGEQGTLAAYVDFEPFYEDGEEGIPEFDPRTARAALDHGVLHETMRTWPGARRSAHPDAGVIAIGPRAEWIIEPHPFLYGYGEGTPFERVVEADGKVAVLGAPLDTMTILHYAEHCAVIPGKRVVRYQRRLQGRGWVDFEEFDTADPVSDALPPDCFEQIGRAALKAGIGRAGQVGAGPGYLFPVRELVPFGVKWIETAGRPGPSSVT